MEKFNFKNGAISTKIIIFSLIIIAVGITAFFLTRQKSVPINNSINNSLPINSSNGNTISLNTNQDITKNPSPSSSSLLDAPIDRSQDRVTKKPFGIYITPNNSPISPEKFTGYHTGVDFETFPDEQDKDVPIYTICSGPLLVKKDASGYGGVVVQKCELQNQAITVIYGHLKLASISANVGQELSAKSKIGILGKGYSTETDGERKHLHLGIHKGSAVNILGYVQSQAELNNWIDIKKYLK